MNEAFFTTEVLSGKTEKLLIYFALPKNLRRNGKHLISINRRTDKEDVVHTHTHGHYSTIKKNETMPFAATWMDLEIITLSEISQAEKDKYFIISLTCGI